MNQISVFFGVLTYEFRMQIRRRSLWITFILLALVVSGVLRGGNAFLNYLSTNPQHVPLLRLVVTWTDSINTVFPIVVGILLADRLPRDRRTKVDELFIAMPGALNIRLVGKFLGTTLATLLPMFVYYCVGIGYILYGNHDVRTLLFVLEAFVGIILPGILFISAFSIACPAVIWVPLYQFLFVGYWFWGNLLPPRFGIPTLTNTILTPIGGYISSGIFGGDIFQVDQHFHATLLQGMGSMSLLLGIAVFVMFVLWSYLRWEQARQ